MDFTSGRDLLSDFVAFGEMIRAACAVGVTLHPAGLPGDSLFVRSGGWSLRSMPIVFLLGLRFGSPLCALTEPRGPRPLESPQSDGRPESPEAAQSRWRPRLGWDLGPRSRTIPPPRRGGALLPRGAFRRRSAMGIAHCDEDSVDW